MLQVESAWAPVLYVFVHHLVDGRPPGVPVPDGAPQGPCALLVRPAGVRIGAPADGLPCTVGARTFRPVD